MVQQFHASGLLRFLAMAKAKNPHAVALGRLGGLKAAGAGGRAQFAKMTAEERSAYARRAAIARWAKKAKKRKLVR
jgi:hypothetical protein